MMAATFAAAALCLGLLALVARMAEEGLGWTPSTPPLSAGGATLWVDAVDRRLPSGWAKRMAKACADTQPARQAAKAVRAARLALRAKRAAVLVAEWRIQQAGRWEPPLVAPLPPVPSGPRRHVAAARQSGTWLLWGQDYLPLQLQEAV